MAFLEPARAALIAMSLIDETVALTAVLADVLTTTTDGTLEKTRASVFKDKRAIYMKMKCLRGREQGCGIGVSVSTLVGRIASYISPVF